MNTQPNDTTYTEETKDYLDLEQIHKEMERNSPYKIGSKNDIAFKNGVEMTLLVIGDILKKIYGFEEIEQDEDNQ